jgi:hypothetical protein
MLVLSLPAVCRPSIALRLIRSTFCETDILLTVVECDVKRVELRLFPCHELVIDKPLEFQQVG